MVMKVCFRQQRHFWTVTLRDALSVCLARCAHTSLVARTTEGRLQCIDIDTSILVAEISFATVLNVQEFCQDRWFGCCT